MKIARLDTLARQDDIFVGGEPEERYERRQMIVVADDYDFVANDATDITSIESLTATYLVGAINYVEYRDALILYAQTVTFSNLTIEQKEVLCVNFAVDKSDRDTVFTSGEQKKHAKGIQELINKANEQIVFESKSIDIADEIGVPETTNISSSSEFGSYIAEASSEGVSSTSSTSYQTKLTLTTTDITSGKYKISWYFETNGSSKEDAEFKIVLNTSTILSETNVEFKDETNWLTGGGFKYETLASGIHTIEIKFRSENKYTSNIRKARLDIIKIT